MAFHHGDTGAERIETGPPAQPCNVGASLNRMPHQESCSAKPTFARDVLHLFTLGTFGVSQPLFDRLSGHVTYLVDYGLTGGSLAFLAGVVIVAVPAAFTVVEALLRAIHPPWQHAAHAMLCGLLLFICACPLARHLTEHQRLIEWGIAGYLALLIAGITGWMLAAAYLRTAWFPRWVTCASPAVLLFPVMFLGLGPASKAFLPSRLERPSATAGEPVPVVLVVFDEFCGTSLWNEEHRIDPVRYPHFARLAETATWYRNATTVHPRTSNALPAILTGSIAYGANRPASDAEYPHNLIRLLHDTGQYEFVVFESVGRFAPRELNRSTPHYPDGVLSRVTAVLPTLGAVYLNTVLPAMLPLDLPRVPPEWYGLPSHLGTLPMHGKGAFSNPWIGGRDVQCELFLDCLDNSTRPCLSCIHVCLPHYPWCYLPSGRRHRDDYADRSVPLGGFGPHGEDWTDDELIVEHAWRQYLLQVGYVDYFIGLLQDRLHELQLFDECLLIVTADHGVSFLPGHSRREPQGANLPEILSVPLLIKYPHQRSGVVDDRNIESIDILPTIADVLDLELPFPVDGSSVLDENARPRARKTLVLDNGELIVVDPRFPAKYESVRRLISTFGTGTHDDRLAHYGLLPDLIGRRIDEFPRVPGAAVEIGLLRYQSDDSEHTPEIVPCSWQGRIVEFGDHDAPLTLAVAVNGVIAGVTRTSRDPRIANRFVLMLPQDAFSEGHENVQWFVVVPGGDLPVLEPCRVVVVPSVE